MTPSQILENGLTESYSIARGGSGPWPSYWFMTRTTKEEVTGQWTVDQINLPIWWQVMSVP